MNQELRLKMENFETESKEEKKLVERLEKEVKEKSKEASRLQIQFSQLNQDFNEAKELLKATKTEIISKDEILKSIQNILTKLFPNSAAPHDLPLWIQTGFSNFSKIIRSMFVDFFEKEELTLPDQKHFKDFIIECLYVIKDSSTQAIYQDKIFIEIFNMIGKFYSSPITKQNCFHIIRRILNEILNLKGNQSFEAFLNESERLKQEINDLKQKNVRSQTIISSQTKQIEILQEYERENWKDWALSVYFSVTRTRSCNLNSSQLQQFIENSLFKVTLLRPYPQVKSGRTIVPLAIAVIFISRLTSQRMPHQISLFY